MNFYKNSGLGSVIMTGLPGTAMDAQTRLLIERYGVCNFILFTRNCRDGPHALSRLCNDIRRTCARQGLDPLIAIDQEGGPVRRLRPPLFPDIPSAKDIATSTHPGHTIKELAKKTADMLNSMGINMNLAPVLDLCLQAEKNVLKGRCLDSQPETVARLGRIYIKTIQERGIVATAKHFPGIGRVEVDPHLDRPVVDSNQEELSNDLIPFVHAIKEGVKAMMTSHVVFTSVEPSRPATFSKKIAYELLRKELGFKGLLLSDDLEMKGITVHDSIEQAATEGFAAGHDLLLICNHQDKVREAIESLRQAIEHGRISSKRLNESISRIHRVVLKEDTKSPS